MILSKASLSHIISILREKGVGYWWTGPIEEFLPPSLQDQAAQWRKGTDTMDVWFDSGTSWTMLPRTDERKTIADVCVEGSDQHRGWFQSQLLTFFGSKQGGDGKALSPYKTLITHGMVLDEAGKKMSKSDGNIISPMTIIHGGKVRKEYSNRNVVLTYLYRIRRRIPHTVLTHSGYGPLR